MKASHRMEDLFAQIAKLYFELAEKAEEYYQLGRHSGPKRALLLSLRQRTRASGEELLKEYNDPEAIYYGQNLILDLLKSELIQVHNNHQPVKFSLSPKGELKAQEIINFEQALARDLPVDLDLQELAKVTRTVEKLRRHLKGLRSQDLEAARTGELNQRNRRVA